MQGFLKKLFRKNNRKTLFQLILEAVKEGKIAIAVDPQDMLILSMFFSHCVPEKDLAHLLNKSINDMEIFERIISYVEKLPPQIPCQIKVLSNHETYVQIKLYKEQILKSIIGLLEASLGAIDNITNTLWRSFLRDVVDDLILKSLLRQPRLSLSEQTLKAKLTSKLSTLSSQIDIESRILDVHTPQDNQKSIILGLILQLASDILRISCATSPKLFEEKIRMLENDIRIYAIKLYGNNTVAINTIIGQYRNIVNNIKETCTGNKTVENLEAIMERAKKTLNQMTANP